MISLTSAGELRQLLRIGLEHQLVVHLEEHPRPEAARDRSAASTRTMAIFIPSAAVPWIGMLIAIRSPGGRAARRCGR